MHDVGADLGFEKNETTALAQELFIDLKTIEVQMLSSSPKTLILRKIFKFINQNLKDLASQDLQLDLQAIIS